VDQPLEVGCFQLISCSSQRTDKTMDTQPTRKRGRSAEGDARHRVQSAQSFGKPHKQSHKNRRTAATRAREKEPAQVSVAVLPGTETHPAPP
jgi:hypothetical protein